MPPERARETMTYEDLIAKLNDICEKNYDPEEAHGDADDALLEFITSNNDERAKKIFDSIEKWYA